MTTKHQRWLLRYISEEPAQRLSSWDLPIGTRSGTLRALLEADLIKADTATATEGGDGKPYVMGYSLTPSGEELASTLPTRFSKEWQ